MGIFDFAGKVGKGIGDYLWYGSPSYRRGVEAQEQSLASNKLALEEQQLRINALKQEIADKPLADLLSLAKQYPQGSPELLAISQTVNEQIGKRYPQFQTAMEQNISPAVKGGVFSALRAGAPISETMEQAPAFAGQLAGSGLLGKQKTLEEVKMAGLGGLSAQEQKEYLYGIKPTESFDPEKVARIRELLARDPGLSSFVERTIGNRPEFAPYDIGAQLPPVPKKEQTISQLRAAKIIELQEKAKKGIITSEEKGQLDKMLIGQPLVQIGDASPIVAEKQIENLRTLQTAANAFNESGFVPNFSAIVKTDAKGVNVIALEAKEKPSSEERNQEVLLGAVRKSLNNIRQVATAKKIGPIQGRWTSLRAQIIGGDPSGAQLKNELTSLIMIVYGLSGKQINENEMKLYENMMPKITDPDDTFVANFDTFMERVKTLSGIRQDLWNKIGISGGQPTKNDIRNTTTEDLIKQRNQLSTGGR